MNRKVWWGLTIVIALALAVGIAWAQSAPQLINYQGRLTDSDDAPLDGLTVDLTFAFYGSSTGEVPLYLTVTQTNVMVTQGVYHVLIGSGTITPGQDNSLAEVFQNHQTVWMGVTVNTDPQMTPRAHISSAPYALSVDENDLKNRDLDGDGHYKLISAKAPADDCNDENPAVHSGAPELCDGIDNQCPGDGGYGLVDEGCPLGPAWPTLLAEYDTPGSGTSVWVDGNYAYVGDGAAGLGIYDISEVASGGTISFAGSYPTAPYPAYGVCVDGDYAYVCTEAGGLKIINVSDPANPTLAGSYATPDHAFDVLVKDGYAFVTCRLAGLYVLELNVLGANTVSTSLAAVYNTPDYAAQFDIQGDYAYVADRYAGLQIINISDPHNPTFAGSSPQIEASMGVAVSGGYAYVMENSSGVRIVNVSDPTNPVALGTIDTPGTASSAFARQSMLYEADQSGGLQIISASNPQAPTIVKSIVLSDNASGVQVVGPYAFVAWGNYGLRVFEIAGR